MNTIKRTLSLRHALIAFTTPPENHSITARDKYMVHMYVQYTREGGWVGYRQKGNRECDKGRILNMSNTQLFNDYVMNY